MSKQPRKKTENVLNTLAIEVTNIIEYIKKEIMYDFNINEIDFNTFLLGAIECKNSMLYTALSFFIEEKKLTKLHNQIEENIKDNVNRNLISTIDKKSYLPLNKELNEIFQESLKLKKKYKYEFITSDIILLSYLKRKEKDEFLVKLFDKNGIDFDNFEENSRILHETTDNFIEGDNENINTLEPIFQLVSPFGNEVPLEQLINPNKNFRKLSLTEKNEIPFCINLNDIVRDKKFSKRIGRKKEINKIMKIMNRKMFSNVILLGETGVGKNAIVERFAQEVIENSFNDKLLENYNVFKLNTNDLISGTSYRGAFEEKISMINEELKKRPSSVLYINEIDAFLNNREYNISSLISPLLENNIKIIIATTSKNYHYILEKAPNISSRFQIIDVNPTDENETMEILNSIKDEYEKFHNVKYSDEALSLCFKLAKRFVTDKELPLSAIDILDEAGANKNLKTPYINFIKDTENEIERYKSEKKYVIQKMKTSDDVRKDIDEKIKMLEENVKQCKLLIAKVNDTISSKKINIVNAEDIYKTVSEKVNIPINKISSIDGKEISNIDNTLKQYVVGQDEAVELFSRAIKRNKIGLSPSNKPIYSAMCIGTPGCGKTLMAKIIAKEIFYDEKCLIRFNMSEFADKTSVNKLIGSSAGYIGYEEGGLLTEALKKRKYAVVLFDEIEKAHEEVYNLFLQILDEGYLTDNTGKKVDFTNTIIIMTSNVGSKEATTTNNIGFSDDNIQYKKDILEKELKKKFPPEFINRLDNVIYFNTLSDENIKNIIKIELNKFNQKLNNINFNINSFNDNLVNYIFNKINKNEGARPIIRVIQNELENKITDIILENNYNTHDFNLDIVNNLVTID